MTGPLRALRMCSPLTIICALLAIGVPAHAWAQPPDSAAAPPNVAADPPAHVAFVDGSAVLERDGRADPAPADMPLLAGDRIRTQNGRVEIAFADGSTLHLDTNTTIDFQSDELVRLLDGRIRLAIPGRDRQVSYRIDTPSASAVILQTGEYKVTSRPTRDCDVELAVLRGAAELANDAGRTPLRAGEEACARTNAAPSYAYAFNSAAWDAFDRWSETRRDQRLGVSAQYLPDEVRSYAGAFDQYGTWQYAPTYGYVWYPRVAVDWRPYYRGRWVTLRPYGWTWVGLDPFAWPTHHFGRWGFSAGAWFWIPGRTWGPAWVSWAYAPGYVSWCPLGWNNRAVIQINVFSRGYDPWRAWTVIPRRNFGFDYVNVHYIAGDRFDARVWRTFEPRYSAPATTGYAVPRSTAPIRVPGTVPPRRSPSTVYTNLEPSASRVPPGDRRVVIGEPRSSVAPLPSPAAADDSRHGAYAVPRGTPVAPRTAEPDESRRTFGVPGQLPNDDRSDEANQRRAISRDPMRRTPIPSAPMSGDRAATPSAPRVDEQQPSYRMENPYVLRPGNGVSRRSPEGAAPEGTAVPRERPAAPGSGTDVRPGGGAERHPPGGDRPPQGPPPNPSGGGDRRGPGTDRGQPAPPPSSGGSGGHSRGGGQPTGGRAVPRGRG